MLKNIFNNKYLNTIYIWVTLVVISLTSKHIFLLSLAIIYTGFLPFLNAVLWLSVSDSGSKLREQLKVWHWAVIFSWLLFLYSLYAQKWTAEVLNEIFHVDAGNFGITYSLLAFLFTPIGLLYHETITGYVYAIFVVAASFLVYAIPVALLTDIPFKKILKHSAVFFSGVLLTSFFLSMVSILPRHLNDITVRFALWADFNSSHLCADEWSKKSESVIFLGGPNMLVYYPSNEPGQIFKVEVCQSWKSF
ncbi:hypothetical protein [Thiolapillus brandeum]|uniref:Uncharacterized protein n=1 Tax=Thiolapillus brandeum TaxID=1076588 RepID=A0A7U6JJX7_9GAMM|nr:hypothetical protein [Thiolapillus brandeum]BAO45773.1 hypothetical protein TBH_P111 [Thiolapillus brandeum]